MVGGREEHLIHQDLKLKHRVRNKKMEDNYGIYSTRHAYIYTELSGLSSALATCRLSKTAGLEEQDGGLFSYGGFWEACHS